MKIRIIWLALTLVVALIITAGVYRFWPSRKQIENAIINVYLKIVCEK